MQRILISSLVPLLALLTVAAPEQALASSYFTVVNHSDKDYYIDVFHGDDSACFAPQKTKHISAGDTQTDECAGYGRLRLARAPLRLTTARAKKENS